MNFKEELKKEVLRQLEKTITGVPISLSEEVIRTNKLILGALDEFDEKELLNYFSRIFIETVLETMLLECSKEETIWEHIEWKQQQLYFKEVGG